MSILIKGMEMPKAGQEIIIAENWDGTIYARLESLGDWCPLVEVPPHGRLIGDGDAIKTAWMILEGLGYRKEDNPQMERTVREVFATAPAIEVEK